MFSPVEGEQENLLRGRWLERMQQADSVCVTHQGIDRTDVALLELKSETLLT